MLLGFALLFVICGNMTLILPPKEDKCEYRNVCKVEVLYARYPHQRCCSPCNQYLM